jgi:hypothetical protein
MMEENSPLVPQDYTSAGSAVVGLVTSLLGVGRSEREGVAAIQGKLTNARRKRDNNAFPGAWFYQDQVTRLEFQLQAAQELEAEERLAQTNTQIRDALLTAGAGIAVLGLLGYAVRQYRTR